MDYVTQECLLDTLRVLNGVQQFNKLGSSDCELL